LFELLLNDIRVYGLTQPNNELLNMMVNN